MDFKLKIYRNGEEHLLVDIDINTIFSQVVMAEHLVRATFTTPEILDLREGDYIVKGIERFTINSVDVPVSKDNGRTFTYDVDFEGYVYDLRDQAFTHLGALEFSLYANPLTIVQIVVDCMNAISGGWAVGTVDDLPEQNMDFFADGKGFTCKEALIKGADAWKIEFWLTGKTINFTKQAGVDTTLVFEHGRGKGLYEIERGKLDQEYFNRLIIHGGTKNIPSTYRGGFKRLRLEEAYLELPLTGGKKRRVGTRVLDEVFPRRTGTLTGVSGDYLELTDTSIDFDLEGQRIAGETAQIKFTSGENAGRSFEIDKYTHGTKTLKIKPLTEADGTILPNATYSIQVGDKYVFLGISMPSTYVTAAETELRVEGLKILNKSSNAKLPYYVFVDQKYLRDNGVTIRIGDRVRVKDIDLGIDDMIRCSGIKYPWVNPDLVDLTISEIVPLHVADKTEIAIKKTTQTLITTRGLNAEKARANALLFSKLQDRLFDPDGNLAEGALTLMAAMLKIGFDSQNFGLINVGISANDGGDENKLVISGGKLVHYVYKITGLGYQWVMTANEWTDLDPLKFYYIYAKCSKTSLVGTWEISETPVLTNAFEGYWVFNVGQLFEVNDEDYRDFDFTKGVTWIVGNQITTGRLQDITKQNFLDLETGQFNLGNEFKGIDWDVTNAGNLTIRGGLIQNPGGDTFPIPVFRGAYDPLATYYTGESVSYLGSTYRVISLTPITGILPTDVTKWEVVAIKGDNGQFTEIRYKKNSSPTVAPGLVDTDFEPSGWSTSEPSLDPLEYCWRTTAVKKDGALVTNWSEPVRFSPVDGIDGEIGPFPLYKGIWNFAVSYYGGSDRVEIVKYGGSWYVTRTDAGSITSGTLPTDTDYFNAFGGTFESIATGLLFASLAYIENLGVRYVRTNDTGKRIEISGDDNNVTFYDSFGTQKILLDDNAAIIGYSIIGGVPTPIYGAGILFGNYGGDYTSVSEKSVETGNVYAKNEIRSSKYVEAKYFVGSVATVASGSLPSDSLILLSGNGSLYDFPEHGQMQSVKNMTGGNITLSAASTAGRDLLDLANATIASTLIPTGRVMVYQYDKPSNKWIQLPY